MTDRIETHIDGRFGRIGLRAGPLNIVNRDDIRALSLAIGDMERCSVVLLEAHGERAFCAGVEVADHLPDLAPDMLTSFLGMAQSFLRASPVIVCAVDGAALGGGFELMLLADLAVCSTRARFSLPEIELAALPPIACALLPKMIGERRALETILHCKELDATTAYAWGLVHEVSEPQHLSARVQALCDRLLSYSDDALRACKRATHAHDVTAATQVYRDEILPSDDSVEGITAFLEKRPPVWKHSREALEIS